MVWARALASFVFPAFTNLEIVFDVFSIKGFTLAPTSVSVVLSISISGASFGKLFF
mgnify:CR=1 FL=1